MNQAAPQIIPLWWLSAMAVACWACLAVWMMVAGRMRRGMAVLPYQPRRGVPWQPIDLLMVLAVYLVAMVVARLLAEVSLGAEVTRPLDMYDVKEASSEHMLARLLAGANVWILLLCGLSAVVVAPIVEEFFFRLLLQGWLESRQRRLRPAMPTLRRLVPGAVGPIVLTSFLFARAHFRVEVPMMNVRFVAFMLAGDGLAKLLAMVFAIGLLRVRVGATAVDLGWVPNKFFADVRLGLLAFAGVAAPIYAAQLVLALLLPKYLAPDPFVLFFFAIALGTLYYRTHRVVPVIVLHMSLNVTSLAMAWLSKGN